MVRDLGPPPVMPPSLVSVVAAIVWAYRRPEAEVARSISGEHRGSICATRERWPYRVAGDGCPHRSAAATRVHHSCHGPAVLARHRRELLHLRPTHLPQDRRHGPNGASSGVGRPVCPAPRRGLPQRPVIPWPGRIRHRKPGAASVGRQDSRRRSWQLVFAAPDPRRCGHVQAQDTSTQSGSAAPP